MAVIDELCVTDFVFHSSFGEDIHGIEDYKKSQGKFLSAFPDFHATLDDVVVEGDKVAVRFTYSATHKGELVGILPTNKKVMGWGIAIVRVAGGKFVELWEREDTLGLMRQLGLVPAPGKGRR